MIDLRHTRLSFSRPLSSYSKLQRGYSSCIRNRSIQLRFWPKRPHLLVNIGCGSNPHPDFLNIDYDWIPGVNLCWDVTRPLPFATGSVDGVFTEHCLEHLPVSATERLLGEICRILKPGATVRIIVPDAEMYIQSYVQWREGNHDVFPSGRPFSGEVFSPIMAVNSIFRDYGHVYAYDDHCLALMLSRQSFSSVKRCAFMEGGDMRLLIDTESRRIESLYLEAKK
jgi:predicted SAM-dependent methyltransferase